MVDLLELFQICWNSARQTIGFLVTALSQSLLCQIVLALEFCQTTLETVLIVPNFMPFQNDGGLSSQEPSVFSNPIFPTYFHNAVSKLMKQFFRTLCFGFYSDYPDDPETWEMLRVEVRVFGTDANKSTDVFFFFSFFKATT